MVRSFKSLSDMPLPQVSKYMASYREATAEHPGHRAAQMSVGLCFLKLKKYDQAIEAFERAQVDNFESAGPFFYAAVARLKGRKPFLCSRAEIDSMETDLHAALSIEPSAEQYYFLSYIGRDYFDRKCLNHQPSWKDLMAKAVNGGFSPADVETFHAMTGTPVDIPLD